MVAREWRAEMRRVRCTCMVILFDIAPNWQAVALCSVSIVANALLDLVSLESLLINKNKLREGEMSSDSVAVIPCDPDRAYAVT